MRWETGNLPPSAEKPGMFTSAPKSKYKPLTPKNATIASQFDSPRKTTTDWWSSNNNNNNMQNNSSFTSMLTNLLTAHLSNFS